MAQQIIELASDPDIDVIKVANTIAKDPGLTAKILRVANSPLYSKQRRSENLRQALVVLGLNAATTLALSFSLVGTYKGVKSSGIDYNRYWRRTILSASAARAFAVFKRIHAVEDVFLAALLQDIAVIAIDKVQPDFYAGLAKAATHADWVAHEQNALGIDHAALGAWLLEHWKLAGSLSRTVAGSHRPQSLGDNPESVAAGCVALGSECVEILLKGPFSMDLTDLSAHAKTWLGMGGEELAATMAQIVEEIPEIERLFDTTLLDADAATAMLEQAREILMLRNLQAIEQVGTLQQSSDYFQTRAADLEDKSRRDPLTGVYNRRHMDEILAKEFESARAGGWPLSVVFADLDRFKQVNDTYGHPAGDTVLIETAKLILSAVRTSDCVARYGGEEFVMILPGAGAKDAEIVCDRLLKSLRATRHTLPGGSLVVTASLGLATLSPGNPFPSVLALIEAADRSVYLAKQSGRDRVVCHESARWMRSASLNLTDLGVRQG